MGRSNPEVACSLTRRCGTAPLSSLSKEVESVRTWMACNVVSLRQTCVGDAAAKHESEVVCKAAYAEMFEFARKLAACPER